jgi:hypothetical protein
MTGAAAILGFIPFFITSKKNKRKAMNMSTTIKMEKATIFQRQFLFTALILLLN